jgi:hypothetical protein
MRAESAEPSPSIEGATSLAPPVSTPWALLRRIDLLFVVILVGAAFLRLVDVDWDQDTHIHPDERFLTMLGNAQHVPSSVAQYLNPATSPLSPTAISCPGTCPYTSFVYGIFPVTLNKIIAVLLGNDTYNNFTLQGRVLSALFDLLLLVFLYRAAVLLEARCSLAPSIKYLAVGFYAVSVLPIQLSHFFTVDMFLSAFMFMSFYFSLRYAIKRELRDVALSGLFFGLAVASKINALAILPLDLYLILSGLFPDARGDIEEVCVAVVRTVRERSRALSTVLGAVGLIALFGIVSYVALRVADPYVFQSASFFDPRINSMFLTALERANATNTSAPDVWYPPGVQWIHKYPFTFALTNLALFGLGLPLFALVVLGAYVAFVTKSRTDLLVILFWVVLFFIFQSTQYVKTMRYFIFLYPFLAFFAGIGFWALVRKWPRALGLGIAISVLIWPLAFLSIYTHDHSRVQASEWMYRNLPNNSFILGEEWDDPLPLYVANTYGKTFRGDLLNDVDWDLQPGTGTVNQAKWTKMERLLREGDYLVLSSNRGWGSMPTVPERFPLMTKFYQDLFAGKTLPGGTRYREIARFTSYPSLRYLGIPIDFPDQWAEEAFTVYDHPEVIIFERVRSSRATGSGRSTA